MRLVILDCETTGLDPQKHQVLEIAAVFLDTEKPNTEGYDYFHALIKHKEFHGEQVALDMNRELIKTICDGEADNIIEPEEFYGEFISFIKDCYGEGPTTITLAGKNPKFDWDFIKTLPFMDQIGSTPYRISYRMVDPAMLFLKPEDEVVPSLQECCDRGGLKVTINHTALDDALAVWTLLNNHFKKMKGL